MISEALTLRPRVERIGDATRLTFDVEIDTGDASPEPRDLSQRQRWSEVSKALTYRRPA